MTTTYKTRHRMTNIILNKCIYYNNRYKLTLPTKTFTIIIIIIGLINSPLIPGGMAITPFIDKALSKLI